MRSQPSRRRQPVTPILLAALALATPATAEDASSRAAPAAHAPPAAAAPDREAPSSTLLHVGISLLVVGAVAGGVGAGLVATSQDESGDSATYTGIGMIIGGGTTFVAGLPITIVGGVVSSDEPPAATRPQRGPRLAGSLSSQPGATVMVAF